MYRCSERLRDWDNYTQKFCFVANILGLIMINKNETITCQLKPIISIRLQLQVNTCHTFGAVLVCIRRWFTLLGGFIQADIQWNCNFSTAIFFAIDSPTLIALKHLTAVSSRWRTGPLVESRVPKLKTKLALSCLPMREIINRQNSVRG